MDFLHLLPLLEGLPLHTGRQNSKDVICEIGWAGVCGGQHVDVGEPLRGLCSVPLTHQEDAERQQGRDVGFPAVERKFV